MRALYKAISVPRVRRASSKGGFTSQSGSGWDEYTRRVTTDCLNWMRLQKVNLCDYDDGVFELQGDSAF